MLNSSLTTFYVIIVFLQNKKIERIILWKILKKKNIVWWTVPTGTVPTGTVPTGTVPTVLDTKYPHSKSVFFGYLFEKSPVSESSCSSRNRNKTHVSIWNRHLFIVSNYLYLICTTINICFSLPEWHYFLYTLQYL